MKRRVAAKLPPQAAGQRLLDYLSSRFDYHSYSEWQEKILNGEIALNGNICLDPGTVIGSSDLMEYFPQNLIEPAVNTNYRIIFEDEHLLVIDKPGNLPVHPAGPYFANTLWALLDDAGYCKVHLVNRLDRETSGLLIAAKDSATAGDLNKKLPEMLKSYYVLVHGEFKNTVNARGFLVNDEKSPIRKKQLFIAENSAEAENLPEKAVAAETLFTPVENNAQYTLLCAQLRTGRMHQIRATLRSMDFPVVGDKLYGLDENFYRKLALDTLTNEDRQSLVLPRQALHCAELTFEHPHNGKLMNFKTDVPEEITDLLGTN